MPTLTPPQAAAMASGVYQLRTSTLGELREEQGLLGCEDMFSVGDNARFQGKSGAGPFKKLSGFGYLAAGEGSFAGEVLIVTRGTAQTQDWISNLNVAMQIGPGGLPVHAGFHEIWKSYRDEMMGFLRGRNPSRIHCVGHSLGGALAMLNADALTHGRVAPVSVYTFGAPRTGDVFFSRSVTKRLGGTEIHRVSAACDPVPMIPVFPFCHMPFDGPGCVIGSSGLVSVAAHNMKRSYIPGVRDQTWTSLQPAAAASDVAAVKSWLEQAADGKGSLLMGSAAVLTMIGKALRWLLERARDLVVGTLGVAVALTATALDQMAWLLTQGAAASVAITRQVQGLIGAVMRFLGRSVPRTADITIAFVRWVLGLLYSTLRASAERALASPN